MKDADEHYIKIPLTLEKHLKLYAEATDSTERHQILWTTWCQNKRWLSHLLEYTLPSFPTYSMHDSTHADSVIHNMELLLGESRIRDLSATDTFMLLHIAFIHDIGMCITESDKLEIIKSPAFNELVLTAKKSSDNQVRNFAAKMERVQYCLQNDEYEKVYLERLDVHKAISYFLSEYRRKEHGSVSKNRLNDIVNGHDALGHGFSISEVPPRIFFQIAECAATHTSWDFNSILRLEKENTGFAHDFMHPRFIAVLLQVADALDIENGRFHNLIHSFYGQMNNNSELHFQKHQSIRQLNITDKTISIVADCESQDVIRLIRNECNFLEELLKNSNYHWSEIAPDRFSGCLPTLLPPKLLHKGKEIPHELINAKFNLSQEKAFKLIEGANVYKDNFPFIREIIQNAIDATKQQIWNDYIGTVSLSSEVFYEDTDFASVILDKGIRKILHEYPIEILLEIVAIDPINQTLIEYKDLPSKYDLCKYKFGIKISIQDHGIGISSQDLINISNVGTSNSASNQSNKDIPNLLLSTGKFGIGLQSIFQVTNVFIAETRTHSGEEFKITFSSGSGLTSGIINTTRLNANIPYGTRIELVLPSDKRVEKKLSKNTWLGDNPFSENYFYQKELKKAEELLSQIIHYINELFIDNIVPIVVSCTNNFSTREYIPIPKSINQNIIIHSNYSGTHSNRIRNKELINNLGWAYQINVLNHFQIQGNFDNGDYYVLNTENFHLYLWSNKYSTFASISGERLYNLIFNNNSINYDGVVVYYRGITTHFIYQNDDTQMFDYVDIHSLDASKILLLNREGLTKEGYLVLENIFSELLNVANMAFLDIQYQFENDDQKDNLLKNLESNKMIFMFTILVYKAHLSVLLSNRDEFINDKSVNRNTYWKNLLNDIQTYCEKNNKEECLITVYDPDSITETDLSKKRSLCWVFNQLNNSIILSVRKNNIWIHKLFIDRNSNITSISIDSLIKFHQHSIKDQYNENIFAFSNSDANKNSDEIILNWLLKINPTKALYSSLDVEPNNYSSKDCVRINVLTYDFVDEIQVDQNILMLLLNKAMRLYNNNHAKAFYAPVYDRYRCLTVSENKLNEDFCFVNCALINNKYSRKMILPLDIEDIQSYCKKNNILIFDAIHSFKNLYGRKIEQLIKLVEEWLNSIQSLKEIIKEFHFSHVTYIMERHYQFNKTNLEKLLNSFDEYNNMKDRFYNDLNMYRLDEKNLLEVIHDQFFMFLVEAFCWYNMGLVEFFKNDYLPTDISFNTYIKYWKNRSETKNLIKYTQDKSTFKISNQEYEKLYADFLKKIFDSVRSVIVENFVNEFNLNNNLGEVSYE